MATKDAEGQVINIGNPDEITIREFAEEILTLTQSNSKITYGELPENDPTQRKPDITRAKEILQWEPKISRKEGLKLTLDYFVSLKKLSSNLKIVD